MKVSEPIEINIKLIEADFWRVSFASRIKRFLLVTVIYLPVAITIIYFAGFGAGATPFDEENRSMLLALFIICAVPFFFLAAAFFSLKKAAAKLEKASEETHFAFSENGIETKSVLRSSKSAWENYEKIEETEEDFVFYLNNSTFHPIPKRFFKDEAQLIEFRELVRGQIGGKAKLKND